MLIRDKAHEADFGEQYLLFMEAVRQGLCKKLGLGKWEQTSKQINENTRLRLLHSIFGPLLQKDAVELIRQLAIEEMSQQGREVDPIRCTTWQQK